MLQEIQSPRNPLIQHARRLQRAKERQHQQQFLVEGTHLVQEALAVGWPLTAILYTPTWKEKHTALIATLPASIPAWLVKEHLLAYVATTEQPDGVVAIAEHPAPQPLAIAELSLAVAVERLQGPDNLGCLIRSSAAAGADAIFVDEQSVDPTNPKVLRGSAGQWFRQPPQIIPQLQPWLENCLASGIQVLVATADGSSLWDYDLTLPTLFLLGNEGAGVSPELQRCVPSRVSIPMAQAVESLNVGVAGSILLYESRRQRHQADCKIRGRSV
jgi:TrmH family RNA methyltransferase